MRYVLFNYVHPDDVAAWEAWTPEEQAADVERHRAWFGKWRAHIAGGEELDMPRTVKTRARAVRARGSRSPMARTSRRRSCWVAS